MACNDKSGWQATMQQTTNDGSSRGRRWLVTRLPEGSGWQLVVKAAGDKSVDGCTTACNDKSGWRQQKTLQQPSNNGSSKGGQRLVSRPPEGSGQWLASKATNNESVDGCTTVCNDESGWQTIMQQTTNEGSSKGWAGAGDETTWGQRLMIGGKSSQQQERWWSQDGVQQQKQAASANNNTTNQKMMGAANWVAAGVDTTWGKWSTIGGKAAINRSVNGRTTTCDDESRQWTTTQQPTNNLSSKGQARAGEETAWGQWSKVGWHANDGVWAIWPLLSSSPACRYCKWRQTWDAVERYIIVLRFTATPWLLEGIRCT
jgi:hypothetical protein